MERCSGERLRLATFSGERWGRESISRDGDQGDLPRMMMSESKDNTLIRLITSSTLVSHRFTITAQKIQMPRRYASTRSLVRSLARDVGRSIARP